MLMLMLMLMLMWWWVQEFLGDEERLIRYCTWKIGRSCSGVFASKDPVYSVPSTDYVKFCKYFKYISVWCLYVQIPGELSRCTE